MSLSDQEVRDAAWNAVAVASTALERERAIFVSTLHLAAQKGLTIQDLASASGLLPTTVLDMLAE